MKSSSLPLPEVGSPGKQAPPAAGGPTPARSAVGSRVANLMPGAQPLLCLLFLVTGEFVDRIAPGVETSFYVLAYFAGGLGSAAAAWSALRHRRIDVNLMMLLAATGAAYLGNWWEGGILLFLFSLSNALEYYAMGRTRRAIKALLALRPSEALVRRDGKEAIVPAEALSVGDIIIVRPAERLPADGVVVAGSSSVDQSPITGESMPVDVAAGSQVFAGTINQRGSLEVEVTKGPEDTTLARIIAHVEQAQAAQPPVQRIIDRFGQVYAVLVIVGSLVTYGILTLLRSPTEVAFYRAITLLVVASPCAIVISTPAAVLSAIANGARRGILFKGGAHLERLADVETVIFDKTGTLTMGKPIVTDVVPLLGDETDVLSLAGAVEQRSEHALADAVVQTCRTRGLALPHPETFEAVTGRGVRGTIGGQVVRIGNEQFLKEEGVTISEAVSAHLALLRHEGKTPILVGTTRLVGILGVADTLRPDAHAVIQALRALDVKQIIMLTGDHRQVAEAISSQLGLDEIRAELLPYEKAEVVEALARDRVVAMVGDGVNDAPALASADIGIAMGAAGTDATMETADVVLMGDGLTRLPYAVSLSRRAKRVVIQNLAFASVVIITLITIVLSLGLRLAFGVVGHEGSTVVVVLNGLRLLRFHPQRP